MTVRQQWSVVLAVLAVLAGGLLAATHFLGDQLFLVSVGSKAPVFHAITVDSAKTKKSLDDYRGQVVLLNIWATYCEPCRVEMPAIERLNKMYAPRGLKVVAVSIDDAGKEQLIREFAREYGLTFEILYDWDGEIERLYQTTGVPETFVIGRDGVIRKKQIGAWNWDSPTNQALIAELLAEPGER
jgi:cytochrome c biogenesis protein CcmG/thiol:disulfide interchange protein DsbE